MARCVKARYESLNNSKGFLKINKIKKINNVYSIIVKFYIHKI